MPMYRAALALALLASACFQLPDKPKPKAEPAPDPASPPPSAAELNSLAGPVLPAHRKAQPGTAAVLPRLKPNANVPDPHAEQAPPRADQAAVDPRDALRPTLPSAQKPQAPRPQQQAAKAEEPAVDLSTLAAPVLPGKKTVATVKPSLPKLDSIEREALGMPDLPPPSVDNQDAKVPGEPLAPQAQLQPAAQPQSPAGPSAAYTITAKGVGAIRIGTRLTGSSEGIDERYSTSFYGDAQPLEGFQLDEPPVFVAVTNGPFASWGRAHPGQPAPYTIRQKALALARAGKLRIGMLVVTDPALKTERGVGVGDSFAQFAKAHPKAGAPATYPGLWEEPSCIARDQTLWFFFDRCDAPGRARLIRIAVRARNMR